MAVDRFIKFQKMSNIDQPRRNQREHAGRITARPGIYR
jgi:hypothetical protein